MAGRRRDVLPNGRPVLGYKDALYADDDIAAQLTGAVRLEWQPPAVHADVQLRKGCEPSAGLEQGLARAMASQGEPVTVRSWRFAEFPYGMNLDYERKFDYYRAPGASPTGA